MTKEMPDTDVKVEFKINGREVKTLAAISEAVKENLERVRVKLAGSSPLMHRISIWLDIWVQRNFASEGERVGGWAPFAEGGRRVGGGDFDLSAKLLQDTGNLRASFFPFHSRRNAGIKSDMHYAKYHQYGNPETNLPQRRMLPVRVEVEDDVRKIIDDFVRSATDA